MPIKDFERFEEKYFDGNGFNRKLFEEYYYHDDEYEKEQERIREEEARKLEEEHRKRVEEFNKNPLKDNEKWWLRNKK